MKYGLKTLIAVFLVSIFAISLASAASFTGPLVGESNGANVTIEALEVNDIDIQRISGTKDLRKTDELEVLVVFSVDADVDDAQVKAELTYDKSDRDKTRDETDKFDLKAGQIYDKELNLELPVRIDQGEYSLKIRVETNKGSFTKTYSVDIKGEDNLLEVRDIVLSPENEVKAGRALLVTSRIKNRGEEKEEDVKVKASIPALGVSASDYIDEIDEEDCNDDDCDDSVTSEELYLRIPDCADPGEYTVKLSVEYDDGDEEITETTKINVVESDTCSLPVKQDTKVGRTTVTLGPEMQDVNKGGSATYSVVITNQGIESKVYSISVDGADWADTAITPSNVVVVDAGESKVAYVAVTPNEAAANGLQVFSATIKSGETVLKQVPLRANIVGGKAAAAGVSKIKKALEVGLVVLVVLLVILGLIIGFNKLKGNDEDDEDKDDKTYY